MDGWLRLMRIMSRRLRITDSSNGIWSASSTGYALAPPQIVGPPMPVVPQKQFSLQNIMPMRSQASANAGWCG